MSDKKVMSLRIADIAVGQRIGFFNEAHAARIGQLIATDGQHDPIHVKRNGNAAKRHWTLVAGLHRLRGVEGIGRKEIDAIEVASPGTSDADLLRLELSENVDHLHRRPIERAIMMFEYARLEEEIDHPGRVGEQPKIRAGRLRHSASVIVTAADDWRVRTAKAFDISLSTFERHQRIYRAVCADELLTDLAQRLNEHPFGESLSVMGKLAGVKNSSDRRHAAELILNPDREWKSISEVFVAAGISESTGFRADPERPDEARFLNDFRKMPVHHRHSIFLNMAKRVPASWVQEAIEGLRELLP